MAYEDPSKAFIGVHFFLFGFDFSTEEKIRLKLLDGGGIDAGQNGAACTHVIVDRLVDDDPICTAARSDGKTVVTGLWVDHSFDAGMPVDPASVMYKPLKDLNGILGARSLTVCLTGYQRQDREDIMTMVGLMGAHFSKPLVANKVTHLICYKFEGEKYELAKKMKKIKLVNHRWLEDSLRAWELLPEADYDKSGYELEMMEAQAKDSEDEAEDQHGERGVIATQTPRFQVRSPKQEVPKNLSDISMCRGLSDGNTNQTLSARQNDVKSNHIEHKETLSGCPEMPGSIDPGTVWKISSGASVNSFGKSPISEDVSNDLVFASKSDQKSPSSSASKFSSIGYSRNPPRKGSFPLDSGQTKSIAGSLPIVDVGGHHVGESFNLYSVKVDTGWTISHGVKTPREILSHPEDPQISILSEKRKGTGTSCSSFKVQKPCHNTEFSAEGTFMVNETEVPRPAFVIDGPIETTAHLSSGNNAHNLGVTAQNNISSTATPEIEQERNEKAQQMSFEKLKSTSLDSKPPEAREVLLRRPEDAVNNARESQNRLEDVHVSSPGTEILQVEKSNVTADLDIPTGGGANSRSKPLKRKLLAKKTLGSRPSFGRGKALNQKGSIHMNNKVLQQNSATNCIGGKEIEDLQRFVDSERIKVISPTSDTDVDTKIEMMNLQESGNEAPNKTGFQDDETEAPKDKEENELDITFCKEISGGIHMSNLVNASKQTDDNSANIKDLPVNSGEDDTTIEAEITASSKEIELEKPMFLENDAEEKSAGAKKRPLKKAKKNHPQVTKIANYKEGEQRKVAKLKMNDKKAKAQNEEGLPLVANRDMKRAPEDMEKNSSEAKKENRPVHFGNQNRNDNTELVEKMTPKSTRKSLNADDPGSVSVRQIPKLRTEPAWFILSGHRLQKKEFQQVIRRLKGRVCRDSHQWSHQATHFIVPDPIRRTEKFFAAAASGRYARLLGSLVIKPCIFSLDTETRWILKTDYLSASNEAGKFLDEEPYEWHKSGLSEDGAINLEAPRKWRLLRERTGHGAFYGMRIIIYGDCIAPPLDTLKRVVKTGDGTILATSPPYSRFLQSGVDFAIVSPGMPRVDIWIQEFLRNEIPCVLADFLVEYVCKPGYSLDRHVQYNMHAWAEKSFKKLINSMNDVVEGFTPQGLNNDDIPCIVCGSRERGEVMLICGDEGGSLGCGVGTHIDCCDPPLKEIPEEDWFCPECTNMNENSESTQKGFRTSRKI